MDSTNIIKIKITPKKGFSFKKSFELNNINCNKEISGDKFLYISFTYKNENNFAESAIAYSNNITNEFEFVANSI